MYVTVIMSLILHKKYNMIRSPFYQEAHLTSNTAPLVSQVLLVDSRLLYAALAALPSHVTEEKAPHYFVWKFKYTIIIKI